ncbi:unnamed protein product [Rhizophagus irregularis]|nr:unnamed protein product [Rhizophagus irregularis]
MLGPVYAGEARSSSQVLNNNSTQQRNKGTMQKLQSCSELVDRLKNNCEFCEFHGPTDKSLIDQENREFFDDRGIMFMWSEMEYGMRILGINKLEGLANYLYHPCDIMEDTGELVPEVELTRHVMEKLENEKLEKKKLAEKNREKESFCICEMCFAILLY